MLLILTFVYNSYYAIPHNRSIKIQNQSQSEMDMIHQSNISNEEYLFPCWRPCPVAFYGINSKGKMLPLCVLCVLAVNYYKSRLQRDFINVFLFRFDLSDCGPIAGWGPSLFSRKKAYNPTRRVCGKA